ncbi:LodA/GoxA family CTQ-dependent oxidase [Streptomyces sp. PT12]|uniref:LodA/GoxA family CTQ-dependent oxidase n=1 Tax=Streptomyces sp. PT12 TaxID=1510197 RepID=UPI000DE337FF|nr:LodA/GoxA family CTQ-dependent oxidase [Streptomyces sp. PT12]RBM18706.1 hypothetical protein DEH69_12450 [Streptomyces sp. PT12]
MPEGIAYATIHPAIGVARVGNSTRPDGWYLGPETPDPPPLPPGTVKDPDGAIRRQGARFRLYAHDAQDRVIGELIPGEDGVSVEWGVHVANAKAAWYAFNLALDLDEAASLSSPRRNAGIADRASLVIDPGPKKMNAAPGQRVALTGGSFRGTAVPLGEMLTDERGRLIVLGGQGRSRSPGNAPLTSFANNDGWCDDTSDGPVTARVTVGGAAVRVEPAWLVVAPPSYAPDVKTVRTLYDLLYDLYVREGWLTAPTTPSFDRDILPILRRFRELQWVNKGFAARFGHGGPDDFLAPDRLRRLASPGPSHQELRRQVFTALRDYDRDGLSPVPWPWVYGDAMASRPRSVRQHLALSATQQGLLLAWAEGRFDARPWPGFPDDVDDAPLAERPGLLDRAALDFCLADAFHPGCEVTWPLRHLSLYTAPFRVRSGGPPVTQDLGAALTRQKALAADGPLHGQRPGGLTRWMAVPWQTDTASCRSGYESALGLGPRYDPHLPTFWPARVPNHVLTEADFAIVDAPTAPGVDEAEREAAFARRASWLRGLGGDPAQQRAQAVRDWHRFGVVETREYTVGDGVFPGRLGVESEPGFALEGVSPTRNLVNVHVEEAIARSGERSREVARGVAETTGLAEEDITVGYLDKLDPFGEDRVDGPGPDGEGER